MVVDDDGYHVLSSSSDSDDEVQPSLSKAPTTSRPDAGSGLRHLAPSVTNTSTPEAHPPPKHIDMQPLPDAGRSPTAEARIEIDRTNETSTRETATEAEHELMPHQVPDTPYVYFTGNRIFLNRLAGVEKDYGATSAALSSTLSTPPNCPPLIWRRELIWRPRALQTALFTSYGTDYGFLGDLTRGSPAAARTRGVTAVDNYDHHREVAGLDEKTHANISVVLPPFFAKGATAADRSRVHHGTMHPKLWLLEFDEGGPTGAGCLRLVISSANLGRYDTRINNQFWVCDFVRSDEAAAAVRQMDRQAVLYELHERRGSDQGDAPHTQDAAVEKLVEARREDSLEFSSDLRLFVRRLLEASAPAIHEQWEALLSKYDLTPPVGTQLILTAPGRYSTTKRATGRPPQLCPVAEADLYGLRALRRHLKRALVDTRRPPESRPQKIEYACSSIGQLDDILQPLLNILPDGPGRSSAPGGIREKGSFVEGASDPMSRAWLVWPSLSVSLPAFASSRGGKGLLTIGGGKNTMTGPSNAKCRELRQCMAHHVPSSPARLATLHHIKMAAGIVRWGRGDEPPVVAWLYAGSHNLSGAAWGKLELRTGVGVDDSESEEDEDDVEFVCMSYEVGVLLIPPTPKPFPLPWVTPATPYDPQEIRPFSTNRYLSILRGDTTALRDGVDDVERARDAVEDMRKQWRHMQHDDASLEQMVLPSLLPLQLAQARKLLKLRVTRQTPEFEQAHRPQSERRRKTRHLKRSTGTMDELLRPSVHTLKAGQELRAIRLNDFSYGEGDEKAYGDPIVSVYEVIDLRRGTNCRSVIDDFDRQLDGSVDDSASASAQPRRQLSVEVIDRNGPRGFLLAFLSADDDNRALLHVLAQAAQDIEDKCWGVLCFQPDALAGTDGPRSDGREPPGTPSHADLLALEFGIRPAEHLPALVLVNADLSNRLLLCKGGAAVRELVRDAAAPLKQRLEVLGMENVAPQKELSLWRRQREERTARAFAAANWVREIVGCRLLLIEPEGCMKKQINTSLVTSAAKALAKRRTSWMAERLDSFYTSCVSFFRALLLTFPFSEAGGDPYDDYDPKSHYGNGPPPGTLRDDAPSIALVTNLGHLVSRPRPGESTTLTEDKVKEILSSLVTRLSSELGVEEEALRKKLTVDVSYRAHGVSTLPPGADAESPEWSDAWSKPQAGMLNHAMAKHGVTSPSDVLMIGYDFVDQEAAANVGIHYVDQKHLIGVERFDPGFDEEAIDHWHVTAGASTRPTQARAPGSFATLKAEKRASDPSPLAPSSNRRKQ